MKKDINPVVSILLSAILILFVVASGCKKAENPIKFPKGTFPDSIINLANINSPYDDYNIGMYQLTGSTPIVFSTNRKSSGGQFDLEQGNISFTFDQTNADFAIQSAITTDAFLSRLITAAVTPGNDFGPYRLFNNYDGYEYLILSSVNSSGDLDLKYLRNRPAFSVDIPSVEGPFPVTLLNSASNDAYLSFDTNLDSAYYTSDKSGNFDIYVATRPAAKEISTWFNQTYTAPVLVDSVNSSSDDKCPLIYKRVMIFTSNRPGGIGGYDLYYSIFRKGKWSSPVNLGPNVNSSSDEYRPVLGYDPNFTNLLLMFSSNRPGGKGGFDLYFRGIKFPDK